MKTVLVYFAIFTFWAEKVLHFRLSQVEGLSLNNLGLYLLVIVWAFTVMKRRRIFDPNNINLYLILMIIVVVASIPVKMLLGEIPQINLWQEIVYAKSWTNPLIIFFLLFNIIDNERTCKCAIVGLVFLLLATVSTMLLHTFGIVEFGLIRDVQPGRSAGFAEANQYATYLVLFVPLLLSFFLFQKGMVVKAISGIFVMITLAGLVITGSRGGIASLVVALTIYFLILGREKKISSGALLLMAVGVVVIGAISYILVPSQYQETVRGRFDPGKAEDIHEYTAGRTILWRNGLTLFMESPLFGHGQNTFIPLTNKRFRVRGNSHNDYLLHLVHFGLIGLGLFVIILSKVFKQAWCQLQTTTDAWKRRLYASYLAGFCGYAFAMLGVNVITPRYIFWFYTAIIYKYGQLEFNRDA